jgi:ribosomal protein S18 acetylase RimI-like enzyme
MKPSIAESMERIDSLPRLDELFKQFFRKETLTNNYILVQDYEQYIEEERLWFASEGDNTFFFLKKDGFFRLYYFLNDEDNLYTVPISIPVVLEILFRGNKRYPEREVGFWKNTGFEKHLRRDCYFLKASDAVELVEQDISVPGFTIKKATSSQECKYAKQLIDANLDVYTGDILSMKEIKDFASEGNIYIAYQNDSPCGILQSKLKNKVFWLDHIVVDESYRGLGISKVLIDYYLQEGVIKDCAKFQLWVISDNLPAVNLYKKYQFRYLNKSTISMLKLPHGKDT